MVEKASAAAENSADSEESFDGPLMDTSKAAIKKLVAKGKERGYITHDELNAALPEEQMNSEQIEDVMARLSEMGINVVESEEVGRAVIVVIGIHPGDRTREHPYAQRVDGITQGLAEFLSGRHGGP